MADILPFRALRYHPQHVSQAVTQPYDKISPAMQDRYYAASPYNLVRIILGRRNPDDNTDHNVYARAASYLNDWRGQEVLRQDSAPSIYAYSQRFAAPGTSAESERLGFIAIGRLEDYSAHVVYRHEQTLAKPKADRLDLLRATRAHFGQLFMLYEDSGEIDSLVSGGVRSTPTIEVTDEYGVVHRVWQITDAALIDSVRTKMRDKKLIIADGHHRYETALNYRDERRTAAARVAGELVNTESAAAAASAEPAPHELVMMTFINMDSPGLLILPTHRVVHGVASFLADEFRTRANEYFSVEEADPGIDANRATGILRAAGQAGTALLAVTADRAFLMSTPKAIGSSRFEGFSLRQQALDVVQLHRCLLEGALGISEEAIRNQTNISYVRDAAEALSRVRSGAANIAFLMNPVRMRQVRDLAFAGEVLPQKSTDFYPKLLSGLTIYALE
jgi:uncharacterized protein (DUF1015 family)